MTLPSRGSMLALEIRATIEAEMPFIRDPKDRRAVIAALRDQADRWEAEVERAAETPPLRPAPAVAVVESCEV